MIESIFLVMALQQGPSHIVVPGDTLSGIAASAGVSLASVEAANPQIADPDLIYAGQVVAVTAGDGSSGSSGDGGSAAPQRSASPSGSSGSLSSVPGVPASFAACVALHESSNGANQAYNGGVYGIINASGEHVNGQSLAAQKAAFSRLYAQYGTSPWRPYDGC